MLVNIPRNRRWSSFNLEPHPGSKEPQGSAVIFPDILQGEKRYLKDRKITPHKDNFDHWWLSGVSVSGNGAMRPLVSYLDKARGHASDGHRSQRFGMSQTAIDVAIDAETNGVDGRDSRQRRVDPTVHCTCLINSFIYNFFSNVKGDQTYKVAQNGHFWSPWFFWLTPSCLMIDRKHWNVPVYLIPLLGSCVWMRTLTVSRGKPTRTPAAPNARWYIRL